MKNTTFKGLTFKNKLIEDKTNLGKEKGAE